MLHQVVSKQGGNKLFSQEELGNFTEKRYLSWSLNNE